VDARGSVRCPGRLEPLAHCGVELATPLLTTGGLTVDPLVEPGEADPEDAAADRVWHPERGPLVGDEAGHAHLVASFTHNAERRIMPRMSVNPLRRKGMRAVGSA
jgi:hypothetical protein